MLAVIFWHARKRRGNREDYIKFLTDFHEGLKAKKPNFFRFSATFETPPVPWCPSGTETFEDWYIVSKFAGMDALDHTVLNDPQCIKPHEWLMRNVEEAKGGFYGLSDGQPRIAKMLYATWFSKPRGLASDELAEIAGAKSECSLWTRAMGAGPMPNCLLTTTQVEIPDSCSPLSLQRNLIWSGI